MLAKRQKSISLPECKPTNLSVQDVESTCFQSGVQKKINLSTSIDSLGLLFGLMIIGLWLCNLITLLSIQPFDFHVLAILGLILLQTFLTTGLFITTHEAIHGLVYPRNPWINHLLGSFCAGLYALLPYEILKKQHWLHHQNSMTENDPDFGGAHGYHFIPWYMCFIGQYWGWSPFLQLTVVLIVVSVSFQLDVMNLGLFWGLPLFLSSLQLFYFGTYRPHGGTIKNQLYEIKSDDFPWVFSFLSCYHFGYHHEHHTFPHVPWWQLPSLHRAREDSVRFFH